MIKSREDSKSFFIWSFKIFVKFVLKFIMSKKKNDSKDQLIANFLKDHVPWETIKSILKTGNSRISRIANQLKNNSQQIQSAKVGRPRKVNSDIIEMIESETLKDPRVGGRNLSNIILTSLHIELSHTTINQIRNNLHFRFTHPRRRPFMTEKHISYRMEFSQAQIAGQIDWGEMVVFSDESRFCMRDDSRRIWVKRGVYADNTFVNEKKYDIGLMVWGAIGKGWRSPLVLVKGKLNSQGYIDLLNSNDIFTSLDEHFGTKQYYFEQDGAPSHTAKKTIQWMSTKNVNVIEKWPANSPDLSCIEQIWSILEAKIQKYKINSLNDLYSALKKEWYAIPQNKLDSLIAKTPERFRLCIENNGKAIGNQLYKLNKEETDFKSFFINKLKSDKSEVNNANEDVSSILHIPLNHEKDLKFCKLIIEKLIISNDLPYFLKDDRNNLFEDFENIIKHPMTIKIMNRKLNDNEYENIDMFKGDLDLLWTNAYLIYGKDSAVSKSVMSLENELNNIWDS